MRRTLVTSQKNNREVILATYFISRRRNDVTDKNYKQYEKYKNKHAIAKMIFNRLYGRYLKTFAFSDKKFKNEYKNGFSIMANCCLCIETIQSFKNGWKETPRGNGNAAFECFFKDSDNFGLKLFVGINFYKNIRCGILHQGETTGGWRVRRDGELLDIENNTINSILFLNEIKRALRSYTDKLESSEWDSKIWNNCRKKIKNIINNCSFNI